MGTAGLATKRRGLFWTPETEMAPMLPRTGFGQVWVEDASADGTVVVGSSINRHDAGETSEAFLWSEREGYRGLGFLPGHTNSRATAVSPDGEVVVGFSGTEFEAKQFIWDAEYGIRDFQAYLAGEGIDFEGYDDVSVNGISADETVFVGAARNIELDVYEGWVADLMPTRELLADFDRNGTVNFGDFLLFSTAFGQTVPPADAKFDLNGSGTIDFPDFLMFSDDFRTSVEVAVVPEPASVLWLLIPVAFVLRLRTPRAGTAPMSPNCL